MKVYSSRKIGKILGISHAGVIKVLKRSGFKFKLPLSEKELKKLIDYYQKNKNA